MKLEDCKIGLVVKRNWGDIAGKDGSAIGHIVGLTREENDEIAVVVQWAAHEYLDGIKGKAHPGHLYPYTD